MNDELRMIDKRLDDIICEDQYQDIEQSQTAIANIAEMMQTLVWYIAKHNNQL